MRPYEFDPNLFLTHNDGYFVVVVAAVKLAIR